LKILFVTSPAKPRKCGITDYLDLLSKELEKQGHLVLIQTIHSPKDFGNVSTDLSSIDLCSIQFSPYGFSSNGISGPYLNSFANALSGKKTHLVFHEIWIGAYPKAKIKEKVMGWRQKREILKFVKLLNPSVAFGTNSAAIDRLRREGIHAEYLYLFGNIPYSPVNPDTKKKRFRVAFFGTVYENFPYELLALRLDKISKLSKQEIELRIIGRQRDSIGLEKVRLMAKKHEFEMSMTNELPTAKISNELQDCSIGVSTTPYDVLGKSGATAAMLEHGLPIYAYDDGDTPKQNLFMFEPFKDQIFLINESSNTERIVQFGDRPRKPFFDGVAHTADNMLKMLS
jgi:glycosyltransferase involved in cell wall biosynthesis